MEKMKERIVLYPSPGIGHLVSMVELGKLIHRHCNISVSILLITGPSLSPSTSSYILSVSQTTPSISFHCFPPFPVHEPPSWSPAARMFHHIRRNAAVALRSLQQISQTSTVRAFVIDLFCSSALSLGKDLGIPTYYFYTSGAAALAAFLFIPTIHRQTTASFKDMKGTLLHFPGLPSIRATQMVEPALDRLDPAYDDMVFFCSSLVKSDGIIVNTFQELEPKAVSILADSETPPVYYLGPLLAQGRKDDALEDTDCLAWLGRQPRRSVVFLCFGSKGAFSAAQVKEIANGLEMSGHRFLWVVKGPPVKGSDPETTEFELDSVLPEGFLERVKERGMVVKTWVPQVEVLSHGSVGGFVTHCGWNSVLEAVVAGVPMVAWPLYAEQHMNRGFLVEHMEIAIPLEEREEDGFVSGAELEKRIRELMDSEHGQQLRQRSQVMKGKALEAWSESGSSTCALNNLLQVWKQG